MRWSRQNELVHQAIVMTKQEIMDIIESSLALEGIETLDGSPNYLIVRDVENDQDYKISLEQIPE